MANLITVQLRRGEGQPWGFRLQGGKDFSAPLVLQRVNGGSVADQAGLMPGDALVKVNSTEVFNLRHKEAQDVIVAAGNSFELTVSRGTAWRPSVTPTGSIPSPSPSLPGNITPVTKTSLAATPQPVQHIGSGHNQAAKPFPAQQPQQQQPQEQVNGSDPIKSIVNMQYNTPVAMYSDETIAETLSSQAEVLAGGVLGVNFKKNERKYSPANSEVYKLLHEQGDNPEPANHQQQPQQQVQQQQHQQHYQQQQQQQQQSNSVVTKHVTAPVDKPPSNTNGLPAGQNICSSCDRLIVGVFVRIKDKNLHADCFKCATCGTSLKNQGYFNLNGKLYCDIHARLAALQSPPPGTNGMVPVTIPKPGQKSGVQAISAALNAHANLNGRSQSPYAANLHLQPPPQSATTTISSGSSSTHQSPSHSRSSSTTSSSGYCNSSSLSPVQSNKVSPLHSRTSSENELHQHYPAKALAPSFYGSTTGSDFCFPPPPPPLLLQLATTPGAGMENPEVVQQCQQPPVEAVDPAAFGPNGLAVAEPTADSTDSAGAAAAATNGEVTQNDYGFFYKTIGGSVIRSVFPPGGASSRYKNQNNITPKPFGAAPSPLVQPPSSFPPVAGSVPTPFSAAITGQAQAPAPAAAPTFSAPQPASYPPVATPAAPAVQAPAPAPAPASVAPAAAPTAVPTPQGKTYFYNKKSVHPPKFNFRGAYAHYLDPELYGDEDEDGDAQVQKPAESPIPPFSWPPKRVEDEKVPIATPLYVPPPETQRVVVKPLVYVPPPPKEKSKSPPKKEQQIQQEQPEQEEELEVEEQTIVNKSVQSKSAPELSRRRSSAHDQSQQEEESYDTYTTTTSTSASSEEYRMYSTQTSQPIVTYYDTPVIEMDYPFGSGQRSTQASTGAMSDASYTHFVFRDPPMEPESVGPSVEPSVEPEPIVEQPKTPLQENTKAQKRVEFVEYRKELERFLKAEQEASEAAEKLRNEIQEVAEEYTIPHYQLPVIDSAKPAKELPKKIVPNPVPKQWQSKLVQMLCIAPNDPVRLTQEQIEEANFMKSRNEAYIREKEESKIRQLEALKRQVDDLERRMGKTEEPEPEPYPSIPHPPLEIPRKGAVMAKVLASSTTKSERFPTYLPAPVVPLPEDSAPYVPTFKPSMEPIRNDKISSYRVSPFLEALTTAPYTPFQTFGTEIPSQMENMPVPSGRISMTDALATVSDRPYTPFKEVKFERSDMYQKLLQEQPSIQTDPDKNFSAFASVGGNRTPVPFKPIIPEIRVPEPEPEPEPEKVEEPPQPEPEPEPEKPKKKLPPYPRKDAGAGHYSLAPKRDNTKSPLNHPAEIPTYQRKWFELPTQNPTRTPEPEELRQNVPLAFVDTHSQSHLAKPIARCNAVDIRDQVQLKKTNPFTTIHNRTIPVAQLPIAVPEDDAELAHFNNAHGRLQAKGVVFDRGQSFTPSLILSKHSTTIPYYQHQLGFEEYFAESKSFDGRNTPMKQCRKSPAFGPPPNPLKPAVPPSRDNIPVESGLYLSMGKLQGTPWYAHSDHVPVDIKQKMQQQQHGMGPGYTGYAQQQRNVHYQEKPVAVQIETQGNTTVQTRSQESALREQASSERTINSASQVGNALIQKRTRIVEEHEHTQEARTVEIAKFSSKIKEDEVPQKGFVAQQTRRFSGQDDALNIPPQMSEAAAVEATPSQPSEPQCTAQFFPQQTSQPSASMFPSSINKPTAQPTSQFFPQQTSQPSAPMFPSANKKPEVFGDKFPTVSSRKASILNPIHPPRSPTPTSGFKAQFNEFMGGAGPLPTLPMQREEPEPVQSWPPVLPSSITSNSNPQQPSVAVAPMKQAVATAPPAALQQQQVASSNGRRSSINNNSNANAINNSTIGFSNITLDSGSDNHFKYSDRPPVPSAGSAAFNKGRAACQTTAPTRGRGVMNKAVAPGGRIPLCGCCSQQIRGPFITALGRIWCPDHFICHNGNCKRALADIGFVEEKGDLYCEYCFEEFLAPVCSKCNARVKGDCLNAIGKQFHPECFKCTYCGKQFGNSPFFLEEGDPYCETDWNELFTTKCFACGFPVEAGDKWVEALNNNYHSQCFNCTSCKKNLEGQSFFAKGGRPFCKNHAR